MPAFFNCRKQCGGPSDAGGGDPVLRIRQAFGDYNFAWYRLPVS
jgi:hypothetical protein